MADYPNPLNTKLDANQTLIRSYDETKNRLRVDAEVSATIGTVDVIIDAASGDNIAVSDGVDTLVINPDGSINVNVQDITLDKTNDSVEVFQTSHDNLNANANIQVNNLDVSNSNPVPISDGGVSLTVDANNLDIRSLQFATDKVDVTGSTVIAQQGTSPWINLVRNKVIDVEFDDILIAAKNDDGNPTIIQVLLSSSLVRTLTITYDADGDFQRLVKS